jgi:arylsulfatase A-like enzyme
MLTGRFPHAIESLRPSEPYPSGTYDPEQCPFWPRVWRRRGYTTAQIGKWHTGVDAGTGRDWDWQIVWNRPKYPKNAGNYYTDQLLSFNGVEQTDPGYSTDNYSRWASEFIRGQHRDPRKPWYLWLCYGAIHGPTTPAKRHLGLHRSVPVREPADLLPPRPGKPGYLSATQAWRRDPDGKVYARSGGETFGDISRQGKPTYSDYIHQVQECTRALDEGVGTVMSALRESGHLDNTLVVFTADQGFAMGEHGLRRKQAPYDAAVRSPLIFSWPGKLPQGRVIKHCVSGPDLVATLHAQAGIRPEWEIQGRDLTPLLKRPTMDWKHPVFLELMGDRFGSDTTNIVTTAPSKAIHNEVPWYIALRTDEWKYVRYLTPGETEELYDLRTDPDELRNLADEPAQRDRLRTLRRQTIDHARRTGAGFADRLPLTRQLQQEERMTLQPRLREVRKIWDQAPHNAFTDLIRHKDRWVCVFREGSTHVSPDGALRVIGSEDGAAWTSLARLTMTGADLRDAKITHTPDGRLLLSGAAALHAPSPVRHQSYSWFSNDGRTWDEGHAIGDPDVWLWRSTWFQGACFSIGYSTAPEVKSRFARLYRSEDGKRFETLVPSLTPLEYPNEHALTFSEDGSALCLLRRDAGTNTAQLGRARPPYREWSWQDLGVRIGGPAVLRLADGRIVAGVRLYDGKPRTSLCWLNPGEGRLEEFLKLPSGGDTSYPGLVWHAGRLWVSYYSSHEPKTSIYLAQVEVPSRG